MSNHPAQFARKVAATLIAACAIFKKATACFDHKSIHFERRVALAVANTHVGFYG